MDNTLAAIRDFLETILLPPKEFCEKLGLDKETEQYLEYITKKAAEKEIKHRATVPEYLHFSRN